MKETIHSYETDNEKKLEEDKASFKREQENEIAVMKANYETLLKEKDQALAEKENTLTEKRDAPPIDYYD